MAPRSLKDLNAVITGGASGLGAVIATRLASEGCNVCLNGLPNDEPSARKLCSSLSSTHNIKATYIISDASSESGCRTIIDSTIEQLGSCDIIIANAGWTKFADWKDMDAFSEAEWILSFKINTLSPMWLFKAVSEHWQSAYASSKKTGVLISTNSLAGLTPMGSSLPYSVTKAGQMRMIEGIAYNNGPWARANAVCPGLIITPWSERYGKETIEAMCEKAPLKKSVDLEVCFLVSVTLIAIED